MRNAKGQFVKGNKNPKWVMDRLIKRMRKDNPAKHPEVRKRISEAKMKAKGGISKLPGYAGFVEKRREIKKKQNGGSFTFGEWETLKAQYNWTCPACRRSEPDIKLTVDHLVPISKGGSDNIENIQPLCSPCNSKKSTKLISYPLYA